MPDVDLDRIVEEYGLAEATRETERYERARLSFGVSYKTGYRTAWWDAVRWVLEKQLRIDDLDTAGLVAELRKGPASVYWPILEPDTTRRLVCECCGETTLHDKNGCPDCGHNYQ